MQAPDILETDETQVDAVPLDILWRERELLRRRQALAVAKVEGELVDVELWCVSLGRVE
jgi:hypothetical protein